MRSLGPFVLLAGIAVGLFVYMPAPVDRDVSLENAQRLWVQEKRLNIPAAIPATSRSFSPHIAWAKRSSTKRGRSEPPASSTHNAVQAAITAPAPLRAVHTNVMGWRAVVTNTAGPIKSGSGAASLKPKDPTSRYKLVVEIQRTLKKRGCYWGRIDGSWGAGSKYAMQAFVDRVNATLPVKEPDYVLLTLLQTSSNETCNGCRSRQTLTVGGRCVPTTIIAETQRRSGSSGQGRAEMLPWKRVGGPEHAAQPLLRPVGTTIVTTAPLPGRMAIGGPRQLPLPSAEDDNWSSSVAAATIEDSGRTGVSQPSITRRPAARRKAKRSRRRYRGIRAARRRNLLLSLGGAY